MNESKNNKKSFVNIYKLFFTIWHVTMGLLVFGSILRIINRETFTEYIVPVYCIVGLLCLGIISLVEDHRLFKYLKKFKYDTTYKYISYNYRLFTTIRSLDYVNSDMDDDDENIKFLKQNSKTINIISLINAAIIVLNTIICFVVLVNIWIYLEMK